MLASDITQSFSHIYMDVHTTFRICYDTWDLFLQELHVSQTESVIYRTLGSPPSGATVGHQRVDDVFWGFFRPRLIWGLRIHAVPGTRQH
jgi:hypothetical protein